MIRNPHNSTPRTMRDCTFCDWADPIERPAPRYRTWPYWLLCLVAGCGGCWACRVPSNLR